MPKDLPKHLERSSIADISNFTCLSIWDTGRKKKGLHQILIAFLCPFAFSQKHADKHTAQLCLQPKLDIIKEVTAEVNDAIQTDNTAKNKKNKAKLENIFPFRKKPSRSRPDVRWDVHGNCEKCV